MKSLGVFSATSAMLMLTACVSNYVAPTAGDTAKLLFKPNVLQGQRYALTIYDRPLTCTAPKRVVFGQGYSDTVATSVKAGALSSLNFSGTDNAKTCQAVVSFFPKAGRSYQLNGNLDEQGCSAVVYDISRPGNPQLEASMLRRTLRGQVCEPIKEVSKINSATASGAGQKMSLDDFKNLLPAK